MNLIDVLIIGFILLGALHGYQKGLVTSVVNLLSSIVGFMAASWGYIAALHWVERFFPLQQWLEPLIYRAILPSVQSKASNLQQQALGNILAVLPPQWRDIFSSLTLPSGQTTQAIEQVTNRLAETLAENLLSLISFGCVFLLAVILIHLLVALLLRPLGSWGGAFNRGGGLLFGGVSALTVLAVLAGVFSPLLNLSSNGRIGDLIQHSDFYPYLIGTFHVLDQVFSAQISKKLLEPLSLGKGVWY